MKRFTFGRYLPMNSFMHNLDPRAKLIAVLLLVVAVFIPSSFIPYILLAVLAGCAIYLSGLDLRFILRTLRPILYLSLFLLLVNILSLKRGSVIFSFKGFEIYSEALVFTFKITIRLLLMLVYTTCLTATTKPLELTLAIEFILSPLSLIKFPTQEVAMMISIALRFIPTLSLEAERIVNAQKSRGVDFEEGHMSERVSAMLSLVVPLFTIAFERAYELADAMEARGYIPGERRTCARELKFKNKDYSLLAISLSVLVLFIFLKLNNHF
ncbi:MAG: energy-coupling factor transporter transmembrane protein EcfT [Sphaerochaetaceae bacterium]|nr:energy-coupling factor transporter transmembrane protein EcfT [Sphaerochaetaceae bacterium]